MRTSASGALVGALRAGGAGGLGGGMFREATGGGMSREQMPSDLQRVSREQMPPDMQRVIYEILQEEMGHPFSKYTVS